MNTKNVMRQYWSIQLFIRLISANYVYGTFKRLTRLSGCFWLFQQLCCYFLKLTARKQQIHWWSCSRLMFYLLARVPIHVGLPHQTSLQFTVDYHSHFASMWRLQRVLSHLLAGHIVRLADDEKSSKCTGRATNSADKQVHCWKSSLVSTTDHLQGIGTWGGRDD